MHERSAAERPNCRSSWHDTHMPNLYSQLHRRYGKPDGITRREMIQRSLAAAGALLISDRFGLLGRRAAPGASSSSAPASAAWRRRTSCRSAGYDVTVVEARNRVGGRVISFSDLVPGKNVEGGGELIGSNHPAWVGYAKQFKLEFLDVGEEDARVPDRAERQAPLRRRVRSAVGGDGEGVRHRSSRTRRRWTPTEPWTAAECRGARPPHARRRGSSGSSASPLCKAGAATR